MFSFLIRPAGQVLPTPYVHLSIIKHFIFRFINLFCGLKVWAIPASGEATEVLSWRQGVVRTLRILPTPGSDTSIPDAFSHKRPLVAICDCAGGPSPQFCSVSFISLRGGDQVCRNLLVVESLYNVCVGTVCYFYYPVPKLYVFFKSDIR